MVSNAAYCKAYRDREAKKRALLDAQDVTFELTRGIREKLDALGERFSMGRDELISTLILAADAGTFSIPRTTITPDDKIFKHLTRGDTDEN